MDAKYTPETKGSLDEMRVINHLKELGFTSVESRSGLLTPTGPLLYVIEQRILDMGYNKELQVPPNVARVANPIDINTTSGGNGRLLLQGLIDYYAILKDGTITHIRSGMTFDNRRRSARLDNIFLLSEEDHSRFLSLVERLE